MYALLVNIFPRLLSNQIERMRIGELQYLSSKYVFIRFERIHFKIAVQLSGPTSLCSAVHLAINFNKANCFLPFELSDRASLFFRTEQFNRWI